MISLRKCLAKAGKEPEKDIASASTFADLPGTSTINVQLATSPARLLQVHVTGFSPGDSMPTGGSQVLKMVGSAAPCIHGGGPHIPNCPFGVGMMITSDEAGHVIVSTAVKWTKKSVCSVAVLRPIFIATFS